MAPAMMSSSACGSISCGRSPRFQGTGPHGYAFGRRQPPTETAAIAGPPAMSTNGDGNGAGLTSSTTE
jgi:hypothetical protein